MPLLLQERGRGNRQDTSSRQKKNSKSSGLSAFLLNISGGDFRSRIASWLMYLLMAAAILGGSVADRFNTRCRYKYCGLTERSFHLKVANAEACIEHTIIEKRDF